MCLYLARRGATYYFRRIIPIELRPAFNGAREFMFSLRTKDRAEAKRRRSAEAFRTDLQLEKVRAFLPGECPEDGASAPPCLPPNRTGGAERLTQSWPDTPAELAHRVLNLSVAPLLTVFPDDSGKAMLDTTIHQAWAAERKPSQKGNDAYRRTAEIFYARVGRKPVDEINKKDVLAFKAALLNDGFSNSNVKVYLSRLRTLLKFAEQNDYSNSNPAAGVSILDKDKDKNKRKSFDYTSLRAVFSSPVYSRGDRPPSGKGEAAYWLPILALFTGARLEELGQLRAQDVTELYYADEDGSERSAWFISIAVDAEDGLRVKNAKSERVIPVHPILERLGFLEYVQSLRLQGHRRVFPALRPGAYGRRTAKWGEWFGGYLRKVCLVTDRRLVFHSFRHTFKDCARHVGMPEGIQRQIMGHSGGDVADEYGEGYSLHQLVEAMKLYRIPGFKIAGRACEDS